MKKSILSFVFLILITSVGYAQVKVGAKLGGSLNALRTSDELDDVDDFDPNDLFENRLNLQAGVFAQLKLADKFVFQPELLYKSKVQTMMDANEGGELGDKFKTSYLAIPVLVGFQPVENLSILLGPEVGLALSAEFEAQGVSLDVKDNLESQLDLGLSLGVDYQLDLGIGFGVRYNHGLNKTLSFPEVLDPSNPQPINLDYKGRELSIYVTYSFLKK